MENFVQPQTFSVLILALARITRATNRGEMPWRSAIAPKKVLDKKLLEAFYLLGIALHADSTHINALAIRKDALTALLTQSAGSNLSETMWLKSEITAVDSILGAQTQPPR